MIELGLGRISRLLKDRPVAWRAIHVAGTNGKGSVCSYASAMLKACDVRCGRFTSPHLIDRWDCISINEKVVDGSLFRRAEMAVLDRNHRDKVHASEFEILTATAFEIFNSAKIEVGIVEVGLGGRYDATNVLQDLLVTVITKIGKDHQGFLGDTLEQIAHHKAGIMKQNVPCVADGSNTASVIEVLEEEAKITRSACLQLVGQEGFPHANELDHLFKECNFLSHQKINVTLAYEAVKLATAEMGLSLDTPKLVSALRHVCWPGRLQTIGLHSLTGQAKSVLLDGAHNLQSAQILGSYVDQHLRQPGHPVTWIVSVSHGKDIEEILACLIQSGDNVIAESFSPVEGMPWVRPSDIERVVDAIKSIGRNVHVVERSANLNATIFNALVLAAEGPVVIAGSLYLVSDVLRLVRDATRS